MLLNPTSGQYAAASAANSNQQQRQSSQDKYASANQRPSNIKQQTYVIEEDDGLEQ